MKSHGENWVSILRELVGTDGKDDLIAGLDKLTGDIEDVRVASAAGYLVAEFKQRRNDEGKGRRKRWFHAAQQSDGTLRVAGLLTTLLQQPRPPVIGVEEPELTVHPGALPMLYEYLRQASEISQILITTHSPILLDVMNVDRDTLFVVERRDSVTRIEQATGTSSFREAFSRRAAGRPGRSTGSWQTDCAMAPDEDLCRPQL